MAAHAPASTNRTRYWCARQFALRETACLLGIALASLGFTIPAHSQTPSQQYVFAVIPGANASSQIAGFSKNGSNGALTPIPGTPLAGRFEGGPIAIDALGRFLFILNPVSNSISMYQVDQSSGAIVEALGSPFAVNAAHAPDGSLLPPICLAPESSGQFLYVGYGLRTPGVSATILQFLIDVSNPASPQLEVVAASAPVVVPMAPFALLADSRGLHLYAGLSADLMSGSSQTNVYAIAPTTGQLTLQGIAGQVNKYESSIAIGGRGKVFADGSGLSIGALESALISPGDGTATTIASAFSLGQHEVPSAMLADSGGSFLYVQQSAGVAVYSIDSIGGGLAAASANTATLAFEAGHAAADPEGEYLYSSQNDGIHAFQVDPQSGSLLELAGSPFPTAAAGAGFLGISGTPGQAVSGPFAAVFPALQDFGGVNVGGSSNPKTVSVTNTGDQALVLTAWSIQGADAGDFSAAPSCSLPGVLPANSSTSGTCSVSVVFSPSAAGLRQASVTFSDNGPGSPQIVPLSGTGVALTPSLTVAPASLAFPATNQGSTSAPMSVTLTSSGSVSLHISSIALSGSNPGDFSIVSTTCVPGSYLPNASCTLSVAFSPSGPNQRSAFVVVADDASGGQQSVALSGAVTGQAVSKPALGIAPASISFAATTQGTISSVQALTLTNSGTAPLHLTSSITMAGANAAEFILVSNGCIAAAYPTGASCTITLKFAPLGTGQRSAALQIADDAAGSPQTVAIAGQSNPAFTVGTPPVGGFSETVTAGQTATYNLQLTGGAGFAGGLTFVCAGAPAKATCNAPAAQISGDKTTTLAITIATTASSLVLPRTVELLRLNLKTWIGLSGILWLVYLLAFSKKWRSDLLRTELVPSYSIIAILFVLLCVAGCAGVAGPLPQTQPVVRTAGTPQGTYAITLTPTVTTANFLQCSLLN
jgi:hypothetical protein